MQENFKIRLLQLWVPEYRLALYEGVGKRYPGRFDIQSSQFRDKDSPLYNINGVSCDYSHRLTRIGPFYWETGLSLKGLQTGDVVIVDGNLRNLGMMFAIVRARLKGLRLVWWAQHWTPGTKMWRVRLRVFLAKRLSDVYLCYTKSGISFLSKCGYPSDRLYATGNTIDEASVKNAIDAWDDERLKAFRREKGIEGKNLLLVCGVVRKKMQLGQLIRALADQRIESRNTVLAVIGDGEDREACIRLAKDIGVASRVIWVGATRDQMAVAPWFLSANVFVYFGAIGLSLIHSFLYGVPVIIHDNPLHHGPEFEVMVDGRTGYLFKEGNMDDFIVKTIKLIDDSAKRDEMGAYAKKMVYGNYSIEGMIDNYCAAIEAAHKRN